MLMSILQASIVANSARDWVKIESPVQQIGRYQILHELGRGAMGIVYKAQDPAIGRTIAIKSIRLEDLTDQSERARLRERLFREAQSAGILSHPGIVTIYDIAEQDGMAYIFMEFVNGPPLEQMLAAEQPPDPETLLSILRQTAAALDYAHKKGIIHRDIKPANIMVHEDGAAKVTDFGVAKIVSQQMTRAGVMMGTPSYMSPEQVQGTPVTGRADQFALAVIAYEALTGDKPFIAEYLPTLLYKIVREDPAPPQRLNATLAPAVEPAILKALAKKPEERYESCAGFVNALAQACAASPGWIPLPRGASHNLPTAGSQDRGEAMVSPDAATVAEAPSVQPPPAPGPAPVLADPLARPVPAPGHLVRNVMLVAAAVVALGVAGLIGLRNRDKDAPQPDPPKALATQEPPSSATPPAPPPEQPGAVVPPTPAPVETLEPAKPEPAQAPPPLEVKAGGAATPGAGGQKRAASGWFQLTTNPPGARAVFDADPATECSTPCRVELSGGRHTFVVSRAGYRESQRVIETPRDTGLIVDLTAMSGTLSLTTSPPGLTVIIDGQEQSRKTPLTVTLPAGEHRVIVVRGSERQEFTVQIQDGALHSRSIEWTQ
jgi:serine/threonine-protein kinase